jgi:hypothetical protein
VQRRIGRRRRRHQQGAAHRRFRQLGGIEAEQDAAQLTAAREVLDRIGGRPGQEVDVDLAVGQEDAQLRRVGEPFLVEVLRGVGQLELDAGWTRSPCRGRAPRRGLPRR